MPTLFTDSPLEPLMQETPNRAPEQQEPYRATFADLISVMHVDGRRIDRRQTSYLYRARGQ